MAKAKVTVNEAALAKIQQQADETARAVIRDVNRRLAGKPADQVLDALVAALRQKGVQPNRANLREYAESISARTLRD